MDHVVFKDPKLNGWEYGMLRSFEAAILKETKGFSVNIPDYSWAGYTAKHFEQGMARAKYRKFFPKQRFQVNADIAWYILMGPENYRLDLFNTWNVNCRYKILYLFDTLPSQYPLIDRILKSDKWDFLVTSFNDSVDDLEKITGRKWHCIEQAADELLFKPVPIEEKVIHFSSYGRRNPVLHETMKVFCKNNGLYYDYTTHDAKHPVVDSTELYNQYAWHLTHSLFTLSWPVELTNPVRAGHLHPITCRWFEAAAGGTIILGKQPGNPIFNEWLQPDLVVDIDLTSNEGQLYARLGEVWQNRQSLFDQAALIRDKKINNWTWNERVNRIVSMLE